MNTRLAHWVELRFWQLAVVALGLLRPLGRGLQAKGLANGSFAQPGWLLSLLIWAVGFVIGLTLVWLA